MRQRKKSSQQKIVLLDESYLTQDPQSVTEGRGTFSGFQRHRADDPHLKLVFKLETDQGVNFNQSST